MFDKLPFKKEHLLIAAVLLLFLLSYKLAFEKTIAAWQLNSQLKAQLTQAADLSYQPDYLSRKDNNLKKVLELYKADTVVFRNNSISNISIAAQKQNVKLSEVPVQDPLLHSDKFIVHKLSFEGSYFDLTRTINTLQNTPGIGVIRSISYKLTNERADVNERKKLVAEVYWEIIK